MHKPHLSQVIKVEQNGAGSGAANEPPSSHSKHRVQHASNSVDKHKTASSILPENQGLASSALNNTAGLSIGNNQ